MFHGFVHWLLCGAFPNETVIKLVGVNVAKNCHFMIASLDYELERTNRIKNEDFSGKAWPFLGTMLASGILADDDCWHCRVSGGFGRP